ncbi:MAG: DUF494 family protein [Xanthomonadales bacterium]|nr:hypothetical protein [Xanthomonadales bacterium]MCC6593658.1 DUF494 family protein [Xanthomonadales bacterium]MCE7931532.1 DUF494 family protein [Xanthomonadales bacterium PRO6]
MKERLLDVLRFLFESRMNQDPCADQDRASLQSSRLLIGLAPREIRRAFEWLDESSGLRARCGCHW